MDKKERSYVQFLDSLDNKMDNLIYRIDKLSYKTHNCPICSSEDIAIEKSGLDRWGIPHDFTVICLKCGTRGFGYSDAPEKAVDFWNTRTKGKEEQMGLFAAPEYGLFYCKKCNNQIDIKVEEMYKYCPNCGQKLNWDGNEG